MSSRSKGRYAELKVAKILSDYSGLNFIQTPGSGSGKIKGDLYLQDQENIFTIEVKFYKDMALNHKMFTQKNNNIVQWWTKLCRQASEMEQEPLLIFKENHSKQYVGTERKPQNTDQYMYVAWLNLYILLLDHWLEKEQTGFTNGNTIYRPWEADTERESISS
jgi:hypothetical protein